MQHYLKFVRTSPIDWLILALGTLLMLAQTVLAWRALRWRDGGFDERTDRWLSNLAQAAEWFPLLGLIGTVAALLRTFRQIREVGGSRVPRRQITTPSAPAITATGSGLFMALVNILPTWMVTIGRDLIVALGGGPPAEKEAPP